MESGMMPRFLVGAAGWTVLPFTEEQNTGKESSLGKKIMSVVLYMLNFGSRWQAAELREESRLQRQPKD